MGAFETGIENGRILIDSNDDRTFSPGQKLTGRLELNLKKDLAFRGIYVDFKGACLVHWTTRHSHKVGKKTNYYTVPHESYEEYLKKTTYLIGSKSGAQKLFPGRHVFPFECLIPPNCPSSFEGRFGNVRYHVKVVVDRPGFSQNQTKTVAFRVIAPLDLNADPHCKNPIVMQFEQSFCCCCVSSGNTETVVKLPAAGWCPKQVIPIEVTCQNNSTLQININLSIIKYVIFTAVSAPDQRSESETIKMIKEGPILARTTRNWTVQMEVPDIGAPHLNGCNFINVNYKFKEWNSLPSVFPDNYNLGVFKRRVNRFHRHACYIVDRIITYHQVNILTPCWHRNAGDSVVLYIGTIPLTKASSPYGFTRATYTNSPLAED